MTTTNKYNYMNWDQHDSNKITSYIYGCYKCDKNSLFTNIKKKIAAFDLDSTIIWTSSGRVHAKDKNDWKLKYECIKKTLQSYHDLEYSIVIITNQSGLGKSDIKLEEWKFKINNLAKKLNLPFIIFASLQNDEFRKPCTAIWTDNIKNISKKTFYCGDAAGRKKLNYENIKVSDRDNNKKDFSDTDYKFALNLGIQFYTPKEFFLDVKDSHNINVSYPIKISDHDNDKEREILTYSFKKFKKKEIIVMCGYPGSGKSYYANNYVIPEGYTRINRDTLLTKTKCIKKCNELLKEGRNVVIDNTNPDINSRKNYLDLAKKYNYVCRAIVMNTSLELSKHNAQFRYIASRNDTDTIIKKIPDIVYNIFKKKYQEPTIKEGFYLIQKLNFVMENNIKKYYKYYF
jgi:bifunctional polynucleotide phosphatase/kinase